MNALWIVTLLALAPWVSLAEDAPYIPVGAAKSKKVTLAYAPVLGESSIGKTIVDTVTENLQFMGSFTFLPATTFTEGSGAGLTPDRFKYSDWTAIGTEILIKSQVTLQDGKIHLQSYVYDVPRTKELFAKKYIGDSNRAKLIAHTFSNDLVKALTGLPGIFLTKIAMVCERRKGVKEIFIMDFDGSDVKQVTQHRSTAMAPSWNPDGTKLAYSLFTRNSKNIKNQDLYELDFLTQRVRLLSNRRNHNLGAVYSPDGRSLAVAMNFQAGNMDVYLYDLASSNVSRLTRSIGDDVDPTWSPDGRQIAFTSTRSGGSFIYIMPSDPSLGDSQAKRIQFAGSFNASPTWAPTGSKIAFASWVDRGFDIFMMNPDGTRLERLTRNQGSNEDPHFSPDGNFLVFSSTRAGKKNVYVMNVDGTFVKRLTYGVGSCEAPKWSQPPR